jgi:hypothetical protein
MLKKLVMRQKKLMILLKGWLQKSMKLLIIDEEKKMIEWLMRKTH